MSRHCIELQNPHGFEINHEQLRRAARAALDLHPDSRGSAVSIVVTKADALRAQNRRYRGIDAPTDVLSFAAEPLPDAIAAGAPYLGDIMIAFDYATERAARNWADAMDILCLLVVHGVLHLLGHTHDDADDRETMWALQCAALATMEINPAIVSEYADVVHD